ncbi:hypothetical protein RHODGE_RHODGE_01061 [Rhodoplanes serenus]|uniref:Uncharacterized protein n=2 Tax=Rhodoplanes TaxID=29407 RepID=A0A447CRX6_9BRAD|nr:hypothetical protein RHODGE_RHODGE_01061 [Rhodoplanes serenus]
MGRRRRGDAAANATGGPLELTKPQFRAALARWRMSDVLRDLAIADNFDMEENVGDVRRDHFEGWSAATELSEATTDYFRDSVQGTLRGHLPSTFDPDLNAAALLPATVERNRKMIRLERIDTLIAPRASLDPRLSFERLETALRDKDEETLTAFTELFAEYRGERPAFAAPKIEVEDDLAEPDWLHRLALRLGLYHFFPVKAGETFHFALMEYTGFDVFAQAEPRRIDRPFALATVLECQNNPAFFPVPSGTPHGFTVDLGPPGGPTVREVLHVRLDYEHHHVVRFGTLTGPLPAPDLVGARERHRATLRSTTGRPDFGASRMADAS